ncbi:fibroleukin isoform X2 [Lingula anatina]|uniref:Fibroleukin isoform X2 n=1 Tax=Lingula anatina TaxID=7574 RepID=A0A1S3HIY1_LINAN|nr:fibroleukin isoform X2 [Lingula anatina]|eukprot:XP_013384954.1 fibroleukin isoform X2 [Lingula anatina]
MFREQSAMKDILEQQAREIMGQQYQLREFKIRLATQERYSRRLEHRLARLENKSNSHNETQRQQLQISSQEKEILNLKARMEEIIKLLAKKSHVSDPIKLDKLDNSSSGDIMQSDMPALSVPTQRPEIKLYRDCSELYGNGHTPGGVFKIHPSNSSAPFEVVCDGKWTVIQRNHLHSRTNFDRGWKDYKDGFGNFDSDFWLGNDKIHRLSSVKTRPFMLKIEIWNIYESKSFYAQYGYFRVANEAKNYSLHVQGYSGNAGDNLNYGSILGPFYHHGRAFTTLDRDNDRWHAGNCAQTNGGGWWYDNCLTADLNGDLYWYPLGTISKSVMKIRPIDNS